jgi:methylase of polypeptide subunit release factors
MTVDSPAPEPGTATTLWAGMELRHDLVTTASLQRDIVLPPSPTTRTLARLMVPRRCRRALDLGTGCGALALLAARLADDVFATDVNPRAIAFARANARANDVSNVTWLEGSLTDPVRGLRLPSSSSDPMCFDLVIGNLPFVISPRQLLSFRDGGAGFSATAVSAAAEILAPDGIAEFLVNWVVTDRTRLYDTPVSWVRATGHGGLVLLHSLQSPEEYVAAWAKSNDDDPDEWLRHLHAHDAVAIANGAVIVHRPLHSSPRPLIRAAPMSSPRGRGGDQIDRILRAEPASDSDILSRHLRLLPSSITEEQGGAGDRRVRIRAHDSCGVTTTVRAEQVELLRRLDGSRCLDDVIDAWAGPDIERNSEHEAAVITTVRRLVLLGLLEADRGA